MGGNDASDKNIAFMLLENKADGPHYHQEWQDMPQATAFLSGEMTALRLQLFVKIGATPSKFDSRRRCLQPQ
jgi:hypothetical protein